MATAEPVFEHEEERRGGPHSGHSWHSTETPTRSITPLVAVPSVTARSEKESESAVTRSQRPPSRVVRARGRLHLERRLRSVALRFSTSSRSSGSSRRRPRSRLDLHTGGCDDVAVPASARAGAAVAGVVQPRCARPPSGANGAIPERGVQRVCSHGEPLRTTSMISGRLPRCSILCAVPRGSVTRLPAPRPVSRPAIWTAPSPATT